MTRVVAFCLLAVAAVDAAGQDKKEPAKDVPKELAPFQGEWKVVSATFEGQSAPPEERDGVRFTFDGDKLIIKDKDKGDKPEAGAYSVDPKATPATIDLVGPKGEKVPGIYKFDKDGKLMLTFVKGKDKPRPKEFDDAGAVVLVLEKVKK